MPFSLFEEIGDVFATIGVEGERILQGTGDFVLAVELAQGDDLLDVMGRVKTLFPELAAIHLGWRS